MIYQLIYKESLRKAMLNARDQLSKSMLNTLSNIIQYRILMLDEFKQAKIVGAYYAIGSEVKTTNIIEYSLNNKRLALPRTDNKIVFARIESMKDLKMGRYNIMEPNDNCEIIKPDLVLVPGIAFDIQGYRIGYGKGYYDKYLAANECYSIGLAYDFQVLNYVPYNEHDVRVKMIVTDKRILRINNI